MVSSSIDMSHREVSLRLCEDLLKNEGAMVTHLTCEGSTINSSLLNHIMSLIPDAIESLNLAACKLTCHEFEILTANMARFSKLAALNIRSNPEASKALGKLCQAAAECGTLNSLDISYLTIDEEAVVGICNILKLKRIGSLNLRYCSGHDLGPVLKAVGEGHSITDLNLSCAKVSRVALSYLSEGIKILDLTAADMEPSYLDDLNIPGVNVLKLREVKIKESPTLASFLSRHLVLARLDLMGCELGVVGARKLAEVLPTLTGLIELNLQANEIKDEGASALVVCLPNSLEVLNFEHNKLSSGSLPVFGTVLFQLKSLNVRSNPDFPITALQAIKEGRGLAIDLIV